MMDKKLEKVERHDANAESWVRPGAAVDTSSFARPASANLNLSLDDRRRVCWLTPPSAPNVQNAKETRTAIGLLVFRSGCCRMCVNFIIESFSTNDESDYEHEIWKKVVKSMRKVSNLVRRTRRTRTTRLKW